jgi:predicted lipid-binding transport protein (Tim44 family)
VQNITVIIPVVIFLLTQLGVLLVTLTKSRVEGEYTRKEIQDLKASTDKRFDELLRSAKSDLNAVQASIDKVDKENNTLHDAVIEIRAQVQTLLRSGRGMG